MTKPEETETKQPEQQQQERRAAPSVVTFSMEEFRAAKQDVLHEHYNMFRRLKDA